MSNSELIDCTRETEKLRMRESVQKWVRYGKQETDKKDRRLQVSGGRAQQ